MCLNVVSPCKLPMCVCRYCVKTVTRLVLSEPLLHKCLVYVINDMLLRDFIKGLIVTSASSYSTSGS